MRPDVMVTMQRGTDVIMHWQRLYFDAIDDDELTQTIDATLARERKKVDFYGVFAPDGRYLAGTILALPPGLAPDGPSRTIRHGLRLAGRTDPPVVHAYVARRADGRLLAVARDITNLLNIRSMLLYILTAGGALCLTAGLTCAVLLSRRQIARLNDIRRITSLIANGDLDQQLPVAGGDELAMQSQLINHMLGQIERLMGEVKGACDDIAHNLRTPLSHVRTLLRQSADRAQKSGDATMARMIEQAGEDTDMLLQRFRAMLRISEIGSLQRKGGFAPIDMVALVVELVDLYEPLAEERGIALSLRRTAPAPVQVHGDRELLFEAFSNLLDNAIKFSPENAEIAVTLAAGTAGPVLVISDQGPGIEPDQRTAVLQRFYRAPQTRDRSGSGLGLSIAAAVVRLHDFDMTIGSAQPGARISISLWPQTLA